MGDTMGMRVINDMTRIYDSRYTLESFKTTVEQNIDYHNKLGNYTTKTIDPHLAYSYQGNLYGLFSAIGIQQDYHIYNAYLNGYKNPNDYDGTNTTFKILSNTVIDNINQIYF